MTQPAPNAKNDLRAHHRRERRSVSELERQRSSVAIIRQIEHLAEFRTAQSIGAFGSMADEIDLWPACKRWIEQSIVLALPRCLPDHRLAFHRIGAIEELKPGYRGILEPPEDAPRVERVDMLLVPGVAFDRRGGRLGMGGGFYDRLLADDFAGFRLGVAYESQLVDALPTDEHDRLVDALVTEAGVHRFAGQSERGGR